ncbi:MAG TPA: hypothetical protein VK860_04480 [Ilumatobacteraceae bacterium]|nr:hypothetical protein [Ilumatobacteraceae bacterium]
MWAILIIAVLFVALVAWRLFVMSRRGPSPSRPLDSGRPHLTDVDPHGPDDRRG